MGQIIPNQLTCEYEQMPLGVQNHHPLFAWKSGTMKGRQIAYQIAAASTEEKLNEGTYDVWDTGKVCSAVNTGIVYGGHELVSAERVFWKVRIWNEEGATDFSEPTWFEMGLLNESDWKGKWMSFLGGMIGNGMLLRYPFSGTGKRIVKARAYVACAGYYEFYMNGQKVGDKLLDPAATDVSKTVLYTAFDITEIMNSGKNAVGLMLGSGWAGHPKALFQLYAEYEDGTVQEEHTDWGSEWCIARGPIVYNSIYDGEDYDARLKKDGWTTVEYEETYKNEHQRPGGWIHATVVENPGGEKRGEIMRPVRIVRRSEPEFVRTLPDGTDLYDVGVNQTGWVRFKVSGPSGSRIELSFAELLREDGTLNKEALRLARCEDHYILRGDEGGEEYAPTFTYHGFRYFTVRRDETVTLEKLTVETMYTDLTENAVFECDNEFLNRMADVMRHTDACNLFGIPTDCPQRDERHGWTTDTTSRIEGCTYHFDMGSFFEKWTRDIYDTQEDGYFADTAPFRWGRRPCDPQVNTPIVMAAVMYQMYGDRRIMEDCYEAMLDYIKVLLNESKGLMISRTGFGEWACPASECFYEEHGAGAACKNVDPAVVSTGYLYDSVSQVQKMAEILGKPETEYLRSIGEAIKKKYNERFYHEEGFYDQNTQSANALAIMLGLVESENLEKVVGSMLQKVKDHHYHMSTGNMGTKALIEALCQNGEDDAAYELMNCRTEPSFGYMLEQGGTTIWERWEADSNNDIMNSRSHPMLAACDVWFYKYLGGIQPERGADGVQSLKLIPSVPKGLNRVSVEMEISNGKVVSRWNKNDGVFNYHVEIPFNTPTTVRLPKKLGHSIMINCDGKEVNVPVKIFENDILIELEAGSYDLILKS